MKDYFTKQILLIILKLFDRDCLIQPQEPDPEPVVNDPDPT